MKKESKEGFEVEATVIDTMDNGKKCHRPFNFKVNSLNRKDIQKVIDYWQDYLKRNERNVELVVTAVYRVEKVKWKKVVPTKSSTDVVPDYDPVDFME
jgi:hypothetical protein